MDLSPAQYSASGGSGDLLLVDKVSNTIGSRAWFLTPDPSAFTTEVLELKPAPLPDLASQFQSE